MARPVWIEVRSVAALSSSGTFVTDLFLGFLDQLQLSTRTIVAVKGKLTVRGADDAAGVDTLEYYAGLITGADTLSVADFPSLGTAGVINPGWMWRDFVYASVSGDGAVAHQVVNYSVQLDVKTKRSLKGVGDQTLWMVHRVSDPIQQGSAILSAQVLLAEKG